MRIESLYQSLPNTSATIPGDISWMLIQSVLGFWPELPTDQEQLEERLLGFAEKALREGKRHGSWAEPNYELEEQLAFVLGSLLQNEVWLNELHEFLELIDEDAWHNSLRTLILRCTCPGFPDTYQGTEYLDRSLVDPDNRRPIDYPARRLSLRRSQDDSVWEDRGDLSGALTSGHAAKQAVLQRLLLARRRQPKLWSEGIYLPLKVQSLDGDSFLAFLRETETEKAVVVLRMGSKSSRTTHHLESEQAALNGKVRRSMEDDLLLGAPAGLYQDILSGKMHDLSASTQLSSILQEAPFAVLTGMP